MPTWWAASGPDIASVAGVNRSRPPIAAHSASPSSTNARVAWATGVNVVPSE
jgi:hypothetical protein